MNMITVNRTIRELCGEIQASSECVQDWRLHTEQDLLYEACVCIFSSQMVFEVAEAGAQTLRNQGLLLSSNYSGNIEIYEKHLIAALSDPLSITRNGEERKVRIRFIDDHVKIHAYAGAVFQKNSSVIHISARSSWRFD